MSRPLAIVPAAGSSRRMGRHKLLLPYRNTTVVGGVVEALSGGGVASILLVHRPDDRELLAWARGRSLGTVENPTPGEGMLSSIVAGVRAVARLEPDPLLVCPGDLPTLSRDTVATLLAAFEGDRAPLTVPVFDDRRGHPLLVRGDLVAEIQGLDPRVGLRQLLHHHAEEVAEVQVSDPGCLRDVDTPGDYRSLTAD